jgi:hypothetical protein
MGRPIKKRYFVKGGGVDASSVVKAEGVTLAVANTGSHYSQGATISLGAPNTTPGVQATAAITIAGGLGGITAATIVNPGEGYTSAPVVTITTATAQSAVGTITFGSNSITNLSGVNGVYVGMLISESGGMRPNTYVTGISGNTVTMSNTATNSVTTSTFNFSDVGSGATFTVGLTHAENDTGTIDAYAYVPGGSSAVNSTIIKQEGSHRYLVENDQGRGQCKLITTSTLTAGTMNIYATDANGSTYYVSKLTGRKAYLTQKTVNGSFAFATGSVAKWTTSTASTGIVSITHF